MATPRYWKDLSPEEKKELTREVINPSSTLTTNDLHAIDYLDYSEQGAVVQMLVNRTGRITTRP